jgi:streptogramin lyase
MTAATFSRRSVAVVLTLLLFASGCAGDRATGFADAGACARSDEAVTATQLGSIRTFLEASAPGEAPGTTFGSLIRPEQIAVAPGALFIADDGLRRILRVDPVRATFTPLLSLKERAAGLTVDRSQTLYVAFPGSRRVVQVAANGQVTNIFQDPAGRFVPVDVAVSAASRIFVADGINARVLVLNRFGQVVDSVGERGDRPNPFRSVDALWFDGNVLYVLDATARRVFLFGGRVGPPVVIELGDAAALPVAIASDRWQRVFVSDRASGKVIVFDPASTAPPGPLAGMPAVQDLADIWVDDFDVLYVADAVAATVFSFRIAHPCQ